MIRKENFTTLNSFSFKEKYSLFFLPFFNFRYLLISFLLLSSFYLNLTTRDILDTALINSDELPLLVFVKTYIVTSSLVTLGLFLLLLSFLSHKNTTIFLFCLFALGCSLTFTADFLSQVIGIPKKDLLAISYIVSLNSILPFLLILTSQTIAQIVNFKEACALLGCQYFLQSLLASFIFNLFYSYPIFTWSFLLSLSIGSYYLLISKYPSSSDEYLSFTHSPYLTSSFQQISKIKILLKMKLFYYVLLLFILMTVFKEVFMGAYKISVKEFFPTPLEYNHFMSQPFKGFYVVPVFYVILYIWGGVRTFYLTISLIFVCIIALLFMPPLLNLEIKKELNNFLNHIFNSFPFLLFVIYKDLIPLGIPLLTIAKTKIAKTFFLFFLTISAVSFHTSLATSGVQLILLLMMTIVIGLIGGIPERKPINS